MADIFGPFLAALAGGFAAYVAIRSDMADLKARMHIVEKSAMRAHDRIDRQLQRSDSRSED